MVICVKTCILCPASIPTEEPAEHVGVPMRIASSVLDARINDIELEGKGVLKDVCVCSRELNGHKSTEQVCCFC